MLDACAKRTFGKSKISGSHGRSNLSQICTLVDLLFYFVRVIEKKKKITYNFVARLFRQKLFRNNLCMNTTSSLQLIPPTSPRVTQTAEFPLSLVYLFLAGIFLIVVCVLILLDRIKGKRRKRIQKKPKESKGHQRKKRNS